MSSNRTETRKAQISAAIKTLKESTNPQEKCKALTCIRSSAAKPGPQDTPTESQSRDICKLVINAFVSGDKVLHPEAASTLVVVLRSYRDRKLNIFNELIRVNFENRLKIFQLFDGLDDDTMKAVSKDAFIVDYIKDCLSFVNRDKMSWMAPSACMDNIKALQAAECKSLSPAELLEEKITVAALRLIQRLYKLSTSPNYAECAKFSPLFVDVVANLAYMGHKRQRTSALNILQLPNVGSHLRSSSPNTWQDYKLTLQNTYCQRMTVLVSACEPDWSLLWTVSIQLLGTDLHRGAGLINNLLSVEEKAFKSVDTVVRRQAFLSWKLIVDNFALDEQELATARRVKLLCIPLTAKNSKTEAMTLTKIEVWWHLIFKLYNHIEKFSNSVLIPFLNFCFGPLGDTPLLSSECNVIASPGKRFPRTRLVAIDAFLQLLADNKDDLEVVQSSLEERIPKPVSDKVFQDCFKRFIHSAGEALLSLGQLNNMELEPRLQIAAVLWKTVFARVKNVKDESVKVLMYKEIMLLVVKLSGYLDNKPMLRDAMLETVIPSLDEFPVNYIFQPETVEDLMSVVTRPVILHKVAKEHQELIKSLLWRGIRPPQAKAPYVSNALELFRKLVRQLVSMKHDVDNINGSSILWIVLCEMVTKYMGDGKEVNEGDAAAHDYTTVQILLKFPFTQNFSPDFWQFKKVAATWKALYKQFDLHASLSPTVKPNEIVSHTVAMIQDGVQADERCAGLAVTCLDEILATMNYKHVLEKNGFLSIVKLMNGLCILNLANGKSNYAEAALRELSSVLITLYGHAPTKVVSCLIAVRPAIEHMLKPCKEESLLREISSTWETIMSIFKGIGGLLSSDLITSFQGAIRLALRHEESDIVSQTLAYLQTEEYMKGRNKDLFEGLLSEVDSVRVEKAPPASTETAENGQKLVNKPAKLAGSFLNRRVASPRTVTPSPKPRDERKSPFFPDPESQEYVTIKSDFKFDAKRLTEHQKESLLRRREDIPALYNDLSQSCSQDTQKIQEWFDKKKNEMDKGVTLNSSTDPKPGEAAPNSAAVVPQSTEVEDANKENKIDAPSSAKVKENKEEKVVGPNPRADGNLSANSDDDNTESNVLVAKKLDFESRTEYPDDGGTQKSAKAPDPQSSGVVEEKTGKSDKAKRESETTQRGVKRKAVVAVSDSDSEGNVVLSRVKRKVVSSGAGADVHSDSDSIKSTESEETLKQLSKRTRHEISRLKINMVFDSKQSSALPGRRRSKINYEEALESGSEPQDSHETGKLTRQKAAKIGPQEPVKNRVKVAEKDTKISTAPKPGKKRGRKPKGFVHDDDPATEGQAGQNSEELVEPVPSEQKLGKKKLKENPEPEERKEAPETAKEVVEEEDNTTETNTERSDPQIQCNDSEEIVESSQALSTGSAALDKKYNNKQCFIRINKMKNMQPGQTVKLDDNNEKNKNNEGAKTDNPVKPTPEIKENDDTQREFCDEDNPMGEKAKKSEDSSNPCNDSVPNKSDAPVPVSEVEEEEEATVMPEANSTSPESRPTPMDTSSSLVRLPSSLLNSCSPKNTLRRHSKVRSVPTQGRAAHMLGLVTKQAIAETRTNASGEDDTSPGKRRLKDGEEEAGAGKKERILVLKEPERLGSPSGSRQEKIFNKMRITPENEAPTPTHTASNLFGNLKNDGEKLSPGNHSESDTKSLDNDNTSPTQEREPLPMLEWSSANPPSLTASPSASILKRQRQLQAENDPESPTLASKRKRVSFADPPVSKEMGYEIPVSTPSHRLSKVSGSRVLLQRKDTPVRLKQTKIKLVQSSPGKSDKDAEVETEKCVANDAESQAAQTPIDDDGCSKLVDDDSDSPVIVFSEVEGQAEEVKTAAKVMIDSFTTEIEIAGGSREPKRRNVREKYKETDVIVIKEVKSPTGKPKTDETETQQDIFDDDTYDKSPKKNAAGAKNSTEESGLRCVDITVLTSSSNTEEKNSGLTTQSSMEVLEDTVDIQNVTGLNSTSNSDEIFCGRPYRSSTQSAEADTLPVTDSVFSNLPFSQTSQTQNDTMELDQPELLDSTRSIFPSLAESCAPIDSVIGYLADPLWKPHLSSHLHSKGIETVGNLAQLTEREVNRIPVKKSPKIPFVRDVLHRFEKSVVSLPSTTSVADSSQESVATPNASISSLPPTSTPIAQSSSLRDEAGNSVIESPRASVKENRSTETQVSVDELLDEVDASVVLKSAIKRCSAENIITSYKMKMRNMAEEDLLRSTIKMLGIESTNHTDAHLKSACRHSGVSKVLGRLPDIFNHDKQFFAKVLTAYRHKLAASDCISGVDFEELKKAICQKCTSSDLAEMLSKKLKEEEEAGVTTPMTELSSLQAMLKRMPKDLIISHTVANEELISPLTVLDIALQNNNPADISGALDGQPSSVRNQVFGDLCTVGALSTQIEKYLSEDTLTEIFKAISKKLETPKLLDAFSAVMKEKFLGKQEQQQPPSNI